MTDTEAGDPEVRQLRLAYSEALWLTEHLAAELRVTVEDLTTYLAEQIPLEPPKASTERGAPHGRT